MSVQSTYNNLLTDELGSSENLFNNVDVRMRAINDAVKWIGDSYNVPELLRLADITFTSGVATIPTRFARMKKLFHATTFQEYTHIKDPDNFDSANNGWTIDYNISAAALRLLLKPTTITTARGRYYVTPYTFTSSGDATDNGMPAALDRPISMYAAFLLLSRKGDPERAKEKFDMATMLATQWANNFADNPDRMVSEYEGTDYLNSGGSQLTGN